MTVITTVDTKDKKINGNIVFVVVLLLIVLFAGVITVTHNNKQNMADFIHENCNNDSFFASASDGNGNYVEFCLMNDGRIGIIHKYSNGHTDGEILDCKEYRLVNILNYINELGSDWRLVWFKNVNGIFQP